MAGSGRSAVARQGAAAKLPAAATALDALLVATSRTFAVSIPLLPERVRREITIAYLLFRIADTFEDATRWPAARRVEALATFERLLAGGSIGETLAEAARWAADPPCDHPGYLDLLAQAPEVFRELWARPQEVRAAIVRHSIRTAQGMAAYVERTSERGELRLRDLDDLRRYCYVVAGIVGEMLTDLFLLAWPPLQPHEAEMIRCGRLFGEGLQLVNVLKDADSDARDGRLYLPSGICRRELYGLARSDLDAGLEYVLELQEGGSPRGFIRFVLLPLFLAWGTLGRIEEHGSGSKLSRPEVARVLASVEHGLWGDGPLSRPALRAAYDRLALER
jgi:farnesyl-diphosphate farnesyltransferase